MIREIPVEVTLEVPTITEKIVEVVREVPVLKEVKIVK